MGKSKGKLDYLNRDSRIMILERERLRRGDLGGSETNELPAVRKTAQRGFNKFLFWPGGSADRKKKKCE